ncbi:hypothetical protein [Corynebacterium cystitidis]|uniref:hypothetical protein n=1 Tax=Corynebacterium cystitidis TaxID=35757 RepID=UPI00211F413C|nr:hypothetical protein [Corynebacterium cystitidis]
MEQSPPYSKTRVNAQGKLWRDGQTYNREIINSVLVFYADVVEELIRVIDRSIKHLSLPVTDRGAGEVLPDSKPYILTARVKTAATLLEKLRRMGNTPLLNVQDIAGIRFDCDLTLTEQRQVANLFAEDLRLEGATRVDIKDYLDSPHSGYRAVEPNPTQADISAIRL